MADFNDIIQEINTNLPDNNTQSITAAKLRTTLIDLTNTVDSAQIAVIDNHTSTSTTSALAANQGKVLYDLIDANSNSIDDLDEVVSIGYVEITPDSETDNAYVYNQDGREEPYTGFKIYKYNVSEGDEFLISFPFLTTNVVTIIALYNGNTYLRDISIRGGEMAGSYVFNFFIPSGVDMMKLSFYKSQGAPKVRKTKSKLNFNVSIPDGSITSTKIADGAVTTAKIVNSAVTTAKIADSSVTTAKIANNAVSTAKIADNTITSAKIADGAVSLYKVDDTVYSEMIPTTRTYNLYDDAKMFIDGKYMYTSGVIGSADHTGITDYIPIEAGETYYFSATSWARTTGFCWYKSDKTAVGGSIDNVTPFQGFHTAPSDAAYLIVTLKWNNVKTVDFMLAKTSVELPYKPYKQIQPNQIENLDTSIEEMVDEKIADKFEYDLRLVKKLESSSDMYYVYEGNDYIKGQYPYTPQNSNFNFLSIYKNSKVYGASDDIPAMHILNTTIGGNHGQPIRKLTITNHGFTNVDIGTGWVYSGSGTANGKTFYIVKIYDADNIGVQSQNDGTNAAPVWTYITEAGGTLTRNGVTKTIEATISTQLWPSETNITMKFFVDNKEVSIVSGDYNQNYYGNVIDIVETYEVKNPVSVLNNLIANAGSSEEPTYEGDSAIKVEHTFRFVKGLNVIFLTNYIPLQEIIFTDFLFAMKKKLNSTYTSNKYYIPNSLPLSIDGGSTYTFDCRIPTNFPSGASPTIWVDSSRKANQEYPINRVLEIDSQNNFGVAMGIFTELGIGRKLDNYTNQYFELRFDSGAIYPTPVNSQMIGTTLQPGQIYSGVMYWGWFNANLSGSNNRMAMYHFNINNAEYVYVDYKGSMLDKIEIDNSFNGKNIEVLESSNATLVNMDGNVSTDDVTNDTYNGGFYVKANYVSDETCYIVLKIK